LDLFSNHIIKTLFFVIFFYIQAIFAQYTENDFVPPLDIPLLLSGNFGELRGSHLHAGLDIKTQGREGFAVRSFWGGKISRIAVSTSGYGKALYVDHPNGKTTVYAHLKKFAPKIEAYVKAQQYERKKYTLQLFPTSEEIEIAPGEVIGYSGNTGGSFGPHLHFEVRDTPSQNPLNPLQYALNIKDHQRPQLRELYLYHHTEKGRVKKQYSFFKENDSLYSTSLIKTSGAISIGLNVFDRQDLSYNKNGVYQVAVWLNGVKKFERKMDRISFNDTKFMGLIMDQEARKTNRKKIERLWLHPKNKASFLQTTLGDGILEILPEKSYLISVYLTDFEGNQTQLDIYVMGDQNNSLTAQRPVAGKEILPEQDYLFPFENMEVYIPKDTFFDLEYLDFKATQDTLHLDKDRLFLRKPMTLEFIRSGLTPEEKKQTCIASIIKDKAYFVPTKTKEDVFRASVKTLGTYTLVKDTIAPQLRPKNFKAKQSIKRFRFLTFRAEDEFSGLAKYNGYINGEWVLLEYEPKNNTLTFDLSDLKTKTDELQVEVIVEDGVGNQTEFKTQVFYNK